MKSPRKKPTAAQAQTLAHHAPARRIWGQLRRRAAKAAETFAVRDIWPTEEPRQHYTPR
jgi:hypothetical protein